MLNLCTFRALHQRKMKRSSKAPVTGVPKLDNPRSGKDCKMHLSNIGKRKAVQQ